MSSEVTADIFSVSGALRFQREGATTPIDIPANGVLQLSVSSGAAITLGGGGALQLVGIEYVDDNGNQVELADDVTDVKFLRAAPGVTITVMNEQSDDLLANVLPAMQRIVTSSGKNFTLESINAQGFYTYVAAVDAFRWFFTDRQNYTPANPLHWTTPPESIAQGLDMLAAGFFAQHGPVP